MANETGMETTVPLEPLEPLQAFLYYLILHLETVCMLLFIILSMLLRQPWEL